MKTMFSPRTMCLTFLLLLIHILISISQAAVPASETFKYVNSGDFGEYIVEYDARPPCWYGPLNRGNPVGENATFSLGTDGNLVLADANGRVAFQSGTANKGVVRFELLSTGNMVLYDAKGKFIWQSFDFPTDTLFVDQHFRVGSKLVSRKSDQQNKNGPYSLVLEKKKFAMYYQPKSSPKPEIYYDSSRWVNVENYNFEYIKPSVSDEITLYFTTKEKLYEGNMFLGKVGYNATVTYLRLGMDGTLRAFTYDQEAFIQAWAVTFDLFSRSDAGTCQLPEKCGNFGLCDKGQCVACPSPSGLLGWSEKCKAPKLSSSSCDAKKVKYYKIVGVDHYVTKFTEGDGPMKAGDCSKKCTMDCKCPGYFYQQDTSMCSIAYDLKTLSKVVNKKHLGFIKI